MYRSSNNEQLLLTTYSKFRQCWSNYVYGTLGFIYICIYFVHVYSYHLQLSAKCYSMIMGTARKSFGVNCRPLNVGHEFPDPYAEIKITISHSIFRGSCPVIELSI